MEFKINLNKYKTLNSSSFPKYRNKNLPKLKIGIQNEKELNKAIFDMRKRINKLEKNQYQIMTNNYNINNININSLSNNNSNFICQEESNGDFQSMIKNNNNALNYKKNDNNFIINIQDEFIANNNKNKIYLNSEGNYIKNKINYPNKNNNNKIINNNNNKSDILKIEQNNNHINKNNNDNKNNNINNDFLNYIKNNKFINNETNKDINNSNNYNKALHNHKNFQDLNNNNNITIHNMKENINNSNANKDNFQNSNFINADNITNLNENNINSKSMMGINNTLLEKLNKLENSINNKDNEIKRLENKLHDIKNKKSSSLYHQSSKFKNRSNYKLSSFSPVQSTNDLDKNNLLSHINRTNKKFLNISQEKEFNNIPYQRHIKLTNEYIQTNNDDNIYIDYNSKYEKEMHRKGKKHKSIDNYNFKNRKYQHSFDLFQNDVIKEENNEDNEFRNENKKNQKKRHHNNKNRNKEYIKHYSIEAYDIENDLSYDKDKHIKHHHHSEEKNNQKFKIKVKAIKKNSSIEKEKIIYKDNSSIELANNNNKLYKKNNINKDINEKQSNEKNSQIKINIINIDSSNNTEDKNTIKVPINKKHITREFSKEKKNSKKNLPIYPKEDIRKYINSKILYRKDELRLLKDKISNYDRKLHVFFDLIYRASDNGDQANIIRDLIENEEFYETLTLFHTYEGARFGVYLKKEEVHYFMKGKVCKEVPGSCFIIGLNNMIIYQIFKNQTANNYFRDILCFGRTFLKNKNGSNWVIYTPPNNFLKQKCIMGYGESLFKHFNIEELVGNEEYHIKEVEIFNVVIEKFYLKK